MFFFPIQLGSLWALLHAACPGKRAARSADILAAKCSVQQASDYKSVRRPVSAIGIPFVLSRSKLRIMNEDMKRQEKELAGAVGWRGSVAIGVSGCGQARIMSIHAAGVVRLPSQGIEWCAMLGTLAQFV